MPIAQTTTVPSPLPTPPDGTDGKPVNAPEPSVVAAPAALQDPAAGGHYVRDPVTGALSLNPAFHASTAQPE